MQALANARAKGKFRLPPSRNRLAALRRRRCALPTTRQRVAGSALTTPHFLLLYAAMLVAAAGNTALQSVMPAIGREIGISDFWVTVSYTWSAVLWVTLAPFWARKSDRHGRKNLTLLGVGGFIASMTLCGLVLAAGLRGALAGGLTFGAFAIARAFYGSLGCATPSATQAYLASRTRRSARVEALSALSSSFSLGTIVGPALAPLFVLPLVGLAGPAVRVRGHRGAGVPGDPVRPPRRHQAAPRSAGGPWRADELSLARQHADRRERHRCDCAEDEAAEVERPAHPRLDHCGRHRRSCAGGDACLPRLFRNRPASPRTARVGTVDRDRHDGRRRRYAGRAMGPDPPAPPVASLADPVGLDHRSAWGSS